MTLQIVAQYSNQKSLCIGEITSKEAEINVVDGYGTYLMSVDNSAPGEPCTVLAKFVSEDAAILLGNFFRVHGHMDAA